MFVADDTPLIRQWILLRRLASHRLGVTVREMAAELHVNQKTIRRDLETFQRVGFPLEEVLQDHGRKAWRLTPDRNQPALNFAYDEALALYLGRRFLEPLAGTPFWAASQTALRKIRAMLGDGAAKYAESFARSFYQTSVGTGDYSRKADIIDALMVGIEECKAVFLTYQSLQATEPTTYDCYPYGLLYHRGSLYLVGHAPDHQMIRHWKVDRIEQAEVTKFPFNRPVDFDLQQHLRGSFGVFHGDGDICVKVRFTPTVARYVAESRWHESQQLARQKDGSVLAEFHLSTTEEIKRWLLSFGRHAEVLEPEELRKGIATELLCLLETYSAVSDSGRSTRRSSGSPRRTSPR